jgi:hypothetical protein
MTFLWKSIIIAKNSNTENKLKFICSLIGLKRNILSFYPPADFISSLIFHVIASLVIFRIDIKNKRCVGYFVMKLGPIKGEANRNVTAMYLLFFLNLDINLIIIRNSSLGSFNFSWKVLNVEILR